MFFFDFPSPLQNLPNKNKNSPPLPIKITYGKQSIEVNYQQIPVLSEFAMDSIQLFNSSFFQN